MSQHPTSPKIMSDHPKQKFAQETNDNAATAMTQDTQERLQIEAQAEAKAKRTADHNDLIQGRVNAIQKLSPGVSDSAANIAAQYDIIGKNSLANNVAEADAITAAHDAYLKSPVDYKVWLGQEKDDPMARAKQAVHQALIADNASIPLQKLPQIEADLADLGATLVKQENNALLRTKKGGKVPG